MGTGQCAMVDPRLDRDFIVPEAKRTGFDRITHVTSTHNHAIRLIDLAEQRVSTLVGRPEMKTMCNIDDPSSDTLGLFEPSDVKVRGNLLYVADTNNHLVRIFDLEMKVLRPLAVKE